MVLEEAEAVWFKHGASLIPIKFLLYGVRASVHVCLVLKYFKTVGSFTKTRQKSVSDKKFQDPGEGDEEYRKQMNRFITQGLLRCKEVFTGHPAIEEIHWKRINIY